MLKHCFHVNNRVDCGDGIVAISGLNDMHINHTTGATEPTIQYIWFVGGWINKKFRFIYKSFIII